MYLFILLIINYVYNVLMSFNLLTILFEYLIYIHN